jgi:FdhE protein
VKPVRPTARDEGWRADVEAVLDKIRRAQDKAVHGFEPDASGLKGRLPESLPLLAPEAIRIDWCRFGRLFSELLAILEEWSKQEALEDRRRPPAGPKPLRRGEGPPDWANHGRDLLLAALKGGNELGRLAGKLGADPAVFGLAVRHALSPFLRTYAQALAEELPEDPDGDRSLGCPLCGAEPRMSEFTRDEGARRLHCGLCGTTWRFARLKCPFCGSTKQSDLGFLEAEGLEGYRVDVCDACGRYVKAVDRRRLLERIDLELADALTPELDEAALERGYLPGPPAERCEDG